MIRLIKKYKLLILLFLIVLYVIGIVFPFVKTKKADGKVDGIASNTMIKEETVTNQERVMLLESNESAWTERIRLLNQAEHSIILASFDIRNGESTKDIASLLLKKAEQGVKVKILVDGISSVIRMEKEVLFQALDAHKNIEIRVYNSLNLLKPWKTQGRMHDKYLIVDEMAYILGGRNTFDYFIGNYNARSKSYDREVLVYHSGEKKKDSDSTEQLLRYFKNIWDGKEVSLFQRHVGTLNEDDLNQQKKMLYERYQTLSSENNELFKQNDYIAHTYGTEGVSLISGETGIYGKEPEVLYQLVEFMTQAKEQVVIHTPYVVCDSYMYDNLRKVVEAVPNVKMLINSVENGDNFMASSDYLLNKKDVLATGIQLYEYDGGISYHGKSIVIDDQISIVGSYNFDMRSTYMDTELMVVIKSKEFTEQLSTALDTLEQNARTVVNEKEYITPETIVVEEIPSWKQAAFWITGRVMQAFRCLL